MAKYRHHIVYETVAVTPLPVGWHNHYRNEDGTVLTEPCAAILLQEERSVLRWRDVDNPEAVSLSTEERRREPPYDTRSVFAGIDAAELYPADDVNNYIRTTGPGEPFPESLEPS